ncbi:universal stress protein [Saccharothrix longispora]|uniref:Nucleotide-binding universal stress UspA family protein n=1 Tax=Saccharothrix longispora TaxID=33920 RepID=A0ABU1PUN8_9PSEU|nr:universal stress protein [Saccharothrix longispora]MDR6594365.1 nucleotide-binding universal stress UspA family protein [Saccharothrix longispora]
MTEIAVVGRPVVVGVDGSESAARAVRWAAREAARRTAPLVIVHACPVVAGHVPEPVPLPRSYHEAVLEQGRERLAEAEAEARGTVPEVEVRTELVFGGAAEDLVGRSASAQLVVLGSRGLGGFTGLLVGSIAVAVSTHGHCPVVVVRGSGPEAGGRREGPVVVGLDGSSTSEAALAFAVEVAASGNAELVAVRTWSDLAVDTAWEHGLTVDWESIQEAEQRLLEQQLAPHREAHPELVVRTLVTRDRPARSLVEHAEHAQLVVVGSRGRGGFRGLLLGSTSQTLIHHAPCPVAVIPPHQA